MERCDIHDAIDEYGWKRAQRKQVVNLYFYFILNDITKLREDHVNTLNSTKILLNNKFMNQYSFINKSTSLSSPKPSKESINNTLIDILKTLSDNQIKTLSNKNKPNTYQFELKDNSSKVNISNIDGKSFINNIRLPINNKRYFITYYGQFQVQCDAYNIKIRPLDKIKKMRSTSTIISKCDFYKPQVSAKIG